MHNKLFCAEITSIGIPWRACYNALLHAPPLPPPPCPRASDLAGLRWAGQCACLTSSQGMLMLLVWGPQLHGSPCRLTATARKSCHPPHASGLLYTSLLQAKLKSCLDYSHRLKSIARIFLSMFYVRNFPFCFREPSSATT